MILGLAQKNSKMFQQFGQDQTIDELLMQEITLNVNVGMGATDPTQKYANGPPNCWKRCTSATG